MAGAVIVMFYCKDDKMVDLDELRRNSFTVFAIQISGREFYAIDDLGIVAIKSSLPPPSVVRLAQRLTSWSKLLNRLLPRWLEELESRLNRSIYGAGDCPPELKPSEQGTIHPLSAEIERISEIFNAWDFVTKSPEKLTITPYVRDSNFPKGHPARDRLRHYRLWPKKPT